MNEFWWLIEMQGPSYMAARQAGGYEFYWTDDVHKALKFFDREQADTVMMAIRQLRGDLFPACLPRVPRATEHTWTRTIGVRDAPRDVEEYISALNWSKEATEHDRTLVAGNIRAFAKWRAAHDASETGE